VKVRDAMAGYLNYQRAKGLAANTLHTAKNALGAFFESGLDDELSDLTTARATELRDRLARRVSRWTAQPHAESTCKLYFSISKAFLAWCVSSRQINSNPLDQLTAVATEGSAHHAA
jgi:site-specific recombinase XerC